MIDSGIHRVDYDELYDVRADPDEANNLAETRPDVMEALELQLNRWREGMVGRRPDPVRVQAGFGVPVREWVFRLEARSRAQTLASQPATLPDRPRAARVEVLRQFVQGWPGEYVRPIVRARPRRLR